MAEVLFAHLAPEVEVGSAGTMDWSGQPAHEYAIAVMAERGLDLSAHRSRRLSEYLVDESDLIVAMTRNHGWAVAARSEAKAAATFPACRTEPSRGPGGRPQRHRSPSMGRPAAHPSATHKPRPLHRRAADEIPDPIGEPLAYFQVIADRLERELAPPPPDCGLRLGDTLR